EERRETHASSEDKLLEENILLLRKQLNCLRRRDAGLISQLQELDQQISDLRLDSEVSHDLPETDSRPSSGFYELSDGVSGSLSNSSNSVFRLADDSSSSGTVRRSLSAPHAPLDPLSSVASCDFQFKYHCDLVAQNSGELYRYPSPLHAVAVQRPALLQMLGHGRDESVDGLKSESSYFSAYASAPPVPQSSSWPPPSFSSQTPPHKRLDSYIYSLVQRRALPVRTSRPRTSINTDPSKSVLRQATLCAKHVFGPSAGSGSSLGTVRGSELKPSWQAGGTATGSAASSSTQGQHSVESQSRESQNVFPDGSLDPNYNPSGSPLNCANKVTNMSTKSLLRKRLLPPSVSTTTVPTNLRELGSPKTNSSPKETKQTCYLPDQEVLFNPSVAVHSRPATPQTGPDPRQDKASLDSSAQIQEEAGGGPNHMVNTQQKNVKQCKGSSKNIKTVKVKTTKMTRMNQSLERSEPSSERKGHKYQQRFTSKRSRLSDEGPARVKGSKRAAGGGTQGLPASRLKRPPVASRHHHCGNDHNCANHHPARDQVAVVAKPKYKRNDCQRLHAIMEVPYDEPSQRAQRQQKKEPLSPSPANRHRPPEGQLSSPYSYTAGSDSEYSAECASLFHSTIMDTSEDERSNYTTNRFGDSESSDEYVEESASASETEEKGGAARQEVSPAPTKAFIKIKASHNLKKKILRFRSGSLKLMTTM
uniref:Dishevelled-binding antagonist of beta-catenin 3a n=1 Tax=Mola mola TaxID=94237 RepID=A0A3Q4BX41_MOLML